MTPQKLIVRVTVLALLIIAVSALTKGVVFKTALAPDDTGRQPVEQQDQ